MGLIMKHNWDGCSQKPRNVVVSTSWKRQGLILPGSPKKEPLFRPLCVILDLSFPRLRDDRSVLF
jgi:hypothetical protein